MAAADIDKERARLIVELDATRLQLGNALKELAGARREVGRLKVQIKEVTDAQLNRDWAERLRREG